MSSWGAISIFAKASEIWEIWRIRWQAFGCACIALMPLSREGRGKWGHASCGGGKRSAAELKVWGSLADYLAGGHVMRGGLFEPLNGSLGLLLMDNAFG